MDIGIRRVACVVRRREMVLIADGLLTDGPVDVDGRMDLEDVTVDKLKKRAKGRNKER